MQSPSYKKNSFKLVMAKMVINVKKFLQNYCKFFLIVKAFLSTGKQICHFFWPSPFISTDKVLILTLKPLIHYTVIHSILQLTTRRNSKLDLNYAHYVPVRCQGITCMYKKDQNKKAFLVF